MSSSWQVAHITSINKRTGEFEVYCAMHGKAIRGRLAELINSQFALYDRVRVLIEVLPYTLRIKMVTKTKSRR